MFKATITIITLVFITWVTTYAWLKLNEDELYSANSLAEQKIINDHVRDPENYNLNDHVLRQEIAAVARWVAKLDKKLRCDNIFDDLSDTKPNNWACRNVEVLIDNDLISRNTNFRPEDKITKSETIWMLIKAIWFDYNFDTNSDKNWQQQIVEYAAEKGVIELFTDYNTDATRGWVFKVADTTMKKDIEIKRKMIEEGTYTDEVL